YVSLNFHIRNSLQEKDCAGGSTKQCGALFCLTFCRLLYPIRKDKTAKAKIFGAQGARIFRQRFAMMRGNSAPLLNQNMSHKLRHKWRCKLTQIIEAKAKP
ncbi:MAG: hypothetical protein LBK66_13905, partial [Spirochaetaceae bacterium]|nr:hypothetical protein [Spirochaetaceae bacterium]